MNRCHSVLALLVAALVAAPFAALVGRIGRFLIEDRAVLVAPNLRLLRTLSSRRSHRREALTSAPGDRPLHQLQIRDGSGRAT